MRRVIQYASLLSYSLSSGRDYRRQGKRSIGRHQGDEFIRVIEGMRIMEDIIERGLGRYGSPGRHERPGRHGRQERQGDNVDVGNKENIGD